jgi:O-ureido-D-serine cyclo-ligase
MVTNRRLALVTAARALGLDEDLPPLQRALGELDIAAEVVVWDDAAVAWQRFDAAVVRSTWDYFSRRDEFLAWVGRVAAATVLLNPPQVLRWSTDKRYLGELASAGVSIVPTTFVDAGAAVDLPPLDDFIVKPAVSAGSNDTVRYRSAADRGAALAHVERLVAAGRTVMVQPYQRAVDEHGETALVYIEGRFSHAIRKGAIFAAGPEMVGGLFARETIEPRTPSDAELRAGEAAIAALPALLPGHTPLLFARVDLVPFTDGTPAVLELELCEPSLFLPYAAGAAERFAAAIARRLEDVSPRGAP